MVIMTREHGEIFQNDIVLDNLLVCIGKKTKFPVFLHCIHITASTVGGDRASFNTYMLHKPLTKIKVAICDHHFDILLVTWYLPWWFLQAERVVMHDTEYPYWDQVSLNSTKLKIVSLLYNFLLTLQTVAHVILFWPEVIS